MKINVLAVIFLFTSLSAGAAEAHIYIIDQQVIYNNIWQLGSTSPANNEALNKPPLAVTLNFSSVINSAGSSISVFDPYNNQLQTGNLIVSGNSMSVTLPKLNTSNNGTYRVDWKALCQCSNTSPLSGSYYFSIQ